LLIADQEVLRFFPYDRSHVGAEASDWVVERREALRPYNFEEADGAQVWSRSLVSAMLGAEAQEGDTPKAAKKARRKASLTAAPKKPKVTPRQFRVAMALAEKVRVGSRKGVRTVSRCMCLCVCVGGGASACGVEWPV
jgi:hypothetical protein